MAAAVASRLLEECLQRTRRPLGLATGRTMEPVYAALAQQLEQLSGAQQQTIRQGWLSFNLDEYVGLAPHDPRTFKAFMAARLQLPLGLQPEQVLLPDGLAQWLVCMPLAVAGIALGFIWQIRASKPGA